MANQQHSQGGTERQDNSPRQAGHDKNPMGNKSAQGADRGQVGQDTDGDGKVVKPGQKPGQSHGTGVVNK